MNDQRPIYPPAPGEPQDALTRCEMKKLGYIGNILVKLDLSDPAHPELILNDNAQSEHLTALLSTDPLVLDWLDDTTDHIVLRIAYTPDTGRTIADLIHVLVMAQLLVGQANGGARQDANN